MHTSDNESRFRHFANIAADLFWGTDAELRFTYLSEGYEAATGIAPEAVLGTTRKELLIGMLDEPLREQHFKLLDEHKPYDDLIYEWQGHDGRTIAMKSWGRPYYDHLGNFAGYRGVASDITESRNAQLALQASESRFQAFAEIAADLFWQTDAELRFIYLSDRYKEVTGIDPSTVIGMTRQELVLDMLPSERREHHQRVLDARQPYDDLEYEWFLPGGKRLIIHSSARPYFDDAGGFGGYLGVARDISESKRAQDFSDWFRP